jgi:ketosteroid isomerase-like protein
MASDRTPREVFEALVAGVAAGHYDELPALYAEQTDVRHPFDPFRSPPLRSRAALAEHFAAGRAASPAIRREVVNALVHETADPEVVVGEFEYRCFGEETGEFSIPCVFVLRVRDGEIVESRDYIDPLARPCGLGRLGALLDELRVRRAREAYLRGMFFGEREVAASALADLAGLDTPQAQLERGKLIHVEAVQELRVQPGEHEAFSAALTGFREEHDAAGEAEALFWLGVCAQFDGDDTAAEPLLRRSYELGEPLTKSYAARHLGFSAAARGEDDHARDLLRESLRLREELSFGAGVAAAQLALAEFERSRGNTEEADRLLAEADRLARAIGAAGVIAWIDASRRSFPLRDGGDAAF